MDISLIAVSLILVVSVFLPVILLNYIGKADSRKRNRIYRQLIARHGFRIAHGESWADKYIGIDLDKGKLLYISSQDFNIIERILPLHTITGCKLSSSERNLANGNKLLLRIDLEIFCANSGKSVAVLNFYDDKDGFSEDFEYQRAARWKALIEANRSKSHARHNAA